MMSNNSSQTYAMLVVLIIVLILCLIYLDKYITDKKKEDEQEKFGLSNYASYCTSSGCTKPIATCTIM